MTAFFLMYRMNNEYTARGEQPIQGILCLDEEKAAGKLHYLAREWQYFPGKLLTPDMLKENTGYYSRYISIGEYGGMELGDKNASPYGCGTYRMILILPKKEQTWALSLKKVFSAYRIYINGELAGEVGDPDEKTYKEQIMNRVFTFQGSEMAEIVIAVATKTMSNPEFSIFRCSGPRFRSICREDCGYLGADLPWHFVFASCLECLQYISAPGHICLL